MAANSQARPRHIQSWERPPAPNIDSTKVWSGALSSLDVQQGVEPEQATAVAQGRMGIVSQTDSRARLPADNEKFHVIIDGEDVGSLYGGGEWKARGVELAVRHFLENGQDCLAIVPTHREVASEQSCKTILRRLQQCFRNAILIQPLRETYRLDMLEHTVCLASEARVILISNHDFSAEISDITDPLTASAFRTFLSHSRVSFEWLGDVLSLQHDVKDGALQGL
jgi:Zc3h12a-like Ribonuclease NYN domain